MGTTGTLPGGVHVLVHAPYMRYKRNCYNPELPTSSLFLKLTQQKKPVRHTKEHVPLCCYAMML